MITNPYRPPYPNELAHHGIFGMRWGIRRYQPYPKGYRGSGREIGDAAKAKHRPSTKSVAQVELAKRRKIEQKSKTAQVKAEARIAREQNKRAIQEAKTETARLKAEAKLRKLETKEKEAELRNKRSEQELSAARQKAEIKAIKQETSKSKTDQKIEVDKQKEAEKKAKKFFSMEKGAKALGDVAKIATALGVLGKAKNAMDANKDEKASRVRAETKRANEEGFADWVKENNFSGDWASTAAEAFKAASSKTMDAYDEFASRQDNNWTEKVMSSGAEAFKGASESKWKKAAQGFADFMGGQGSKWKSKFASGFARKASEVYGEGTSKSNPFENFNPFDKSGAVDVEFWDVTPASTTALAVVDDSMRKLM